MALNNVSLNKLLKMLPRPLGARKTIIVRDASDAVLKEKKVQNEDGGDFYASFWCDAKKFLLRGEDLRQLVSERIRRNPPKLRLYPMLRDGFLRWYEVQFGETDSADRDEIANAFGKCTSLTPSGDVRVHGILAWKEPDGSRHLVYPYFDKDFSLGPRAARLGRWTMASALPKYDAESMTILDVLRGAAYGNDNCPLLGNEEQVLSERYEGYLREWEAQKRLLRRS